MTSHLHLFLKISLMINCELIWLGLGISDLVYYLLNFNIPLFWQQAHPHITSYPKLLHSSKEHLYNLLICFRCYHRLLLLPDWLDRFLPSEIIYTKHLKICTLWLQNLHDPRRKYSASSKVYRAVDLFFISSM